MIFEQINESEHSIPTIQPITTLETSKTFEIFPTENENSPVNLSKNPISVLFVTN